MENLLNGEKLNQQDSLCGKETFKVNKTRSGVERMLAYSLFVVILPT